MAHARARTKLQLGSAVPPIDPDRLITTQAAADLLGMSRPHLVKALHEGALSCIQVGEQRRLRLAEILEFREGRRRESEERLRELLAMAQEQSLVGKSMGNRVQEGTEAPSGVARDQGRSASFAQSRVGERAAVG